MPDGCALFFYSCNITNSHPANIGPQDVPRTFPKDPIGPSRGRPDLTS